MRKASRRSSRGDEVEITEPEPDAEASGEPEVDLEQPMPPVEPAAVEQPTA